MLNKEASMPKEWETRKSKRRTCRHCEKHYKCKKQSHHDKYDPNEKRWMSICDNCGMVDYAEKTA